MAVPEYSELYEPVLKALEDGNIRSVSEIRDRAAKALNLSDEDMAVLLPSGKQTVFSSRLVWAKTYLSKAGLVEGRTPAHYVITQEGKKLLASGEVITNELLAERYPKFAEFANKKVTDSKTGGENPDAQEIQPEAVQKEEDETPEETLERAYGIINEQLADDLLKKIGEQTSAFLGKLVLDLMQAMGYGVWREVPKHSGSEVITGVIYEDKLGFDQIYIQAEMSHCGAVIEKHKIHEFAGAMMGPPKFAKGIYITTTKFSQDAQKFAQDQHIVLVDGRKLAQLMIEHGVGVSEEKVYKIKRVNGDYFNPDQ